MNARSTGVRREKRKTEMDHRLMGARLAGGARASRSPGTADLIAGAVAAAVAVFEGSRP
jgi:hypothetical protein